MLLPEVGMPSEFVKIFKNHLVSDGSKAITPPEDEFSFSVEWSMYKYSSLTWELDLKERVDYFCYYINKTRDSLDGLLILDAGCGNGTLSAAIAATGARVVAMDYSNSIEKAEINKKHFSWDNFRRLYYVQGDVQHPPFSENIFVR
jgi:SAM-dependent methyltransferase